VERREARCPARGLRKRVRVAQPRAPQVLTGLYSRDYSPLRAASRGRRRMAPGCADPQGRPPAFAALNRATGFHAAGWRRSGHGPKRAKDL